MSKLRETAPPPEDVAAEEAAPVAPSAEFSLTPAQATFMLQSGMFLLAVFVVMYVAKAIILPVILAFVLKLLLNPAFRWLQRLGLPRVLGALLLLVALSATIVGLVAALSGPAVDWFAKLPGGIPRLQEKLEFLRQPVEIFRRFLAAMRGLAPWKARWSRSRRARAPCPSSFLPAPGTSPPACSPPGFCCSSC